MLTPLIIDTAWPLEDKQSIWFNCAVGNIVKICLNMVHCEKSDVAENISQSLAQSAVWSLCLWQQKSRDPLYSDDIFCLPINVLTHSAQVMNEDDFWATGAYLTVTLAQEPVQRSSHQGP